MLREEDISLGRIDDLLCALLQSIFELRQVSRASSRIAQSKTRKRLTIGMISAGSRFNLLASSSLYEMRWVMSTSHEYRLTSTFSRS